MVGLPSTTLEPSTEQRLRALGPGGVILFGRNLDTPQQTSELLGTLRRLLPRPTLLALDQEGGRVSRLERWIGPTPTATVLATMGAESVERFARLTGEALHALGFNLDFAPVVDLSDADADNGIAERSFGTDAPRVVQLAGRFLEGLQSAQVAGCLKHFPGLGGTTVDSHVDLPTVGRGLEELVSRDLLPYRELARRAASVMVGHGYYPEWTPDARLPATCSARIVDGVLREQLGYRGLVVSDDLEMGAIASRDRDGQAAVEVLRAGCDLLLYCSDLDRAVAARDALAAAAGNDPSLARRLGAAAAAVTDTAERWSQAEPRLEAWENARAELERFAG